MTLGVGPGVFPGVAWGLPCGLGDGVTRKALSRSGYSKLTAEKKKE